MDDVKKVIVGAVATLIIGGGAYTVSQTDVINNFSQDTGMTKQQAEDYVKNLDEDSKDTWTNIGKEFITDSEDVLATASEINCAEYQYEWESETLTCDFGKAQLTELGNSEHTLGESYIKLDDKNSTESDISTTITNIDSVNKCMDYEIVSQLLEKDSIMDMKNTNSYNKSLLKAAIEGN